MAAGVHPVAGTVRDRASKCSKSHARPWRWAGACLILAASMAPTTAYEADPRFLFISVPDKGSIYYAPLPDFSELSKDSEDRKALEAQVLIKGGSGNQDGSILLETGRSTRRSGNGTQATTVAAGSLVRPQGLAMWHGKDRAVLYVADQSQSKIFAYEITGGVDFDPDDAMKFGTIQAGSQKTVAKDIQDVTGLALDGFGSLYYSSLKGEVGFFKSDQLNPLSGSPVSTVLYAADSQDTVQNPFAVAADNFNVYWANQANGQQQGVLISAFERSSGNMSAKYPDYPKALAKNAAKAMGVCIARNNIFFSAENQFLYGVKAAGGSVTEVHGGFEKPRGCAYDGEGTLYVADEGGDSTTASTATTADSTDAASTGGDSTGGDGTAADSTTSTPQAGAVYSLPANFPTLRPVKRVQKVATITGGKPSSVAVFTRAEAYLLKDKWFFGIF